jgi:hypothetical protein
VFGFHGYPTAAAQRGIQQLLSNTNEPRLLILDKVFLKDQNKNAQRVQSTAISDAIRGLFIDFNLGLVYYCIFPHSLSALCALASCATL